jgi:hypothetical protein
MRIHFVIPVNSTIIVATYSPVDTDVIKQPMNTLTARSPQICLNRLIPFGGCDFVGALAVRRVIYLRPVQSENSSLRLFGRHTEQR